MTQPPLWRSILRNTIHSVEELATFLQLSEAQKQQLILAPKFPLQIPLRLAEKMTKGSLEDPLVLQFLPMKKEDEKHPLFVVDPVCDASFQKKKKILHKYEGRVLIVCTSACAMHCRYCFRQNFDYSKEGGFEEELQFIASDSSIEEVILSGGDPLSLSNETLKKLLLELDKLSHVRRIRFHTRFPIGIPERIDAEFLEIARMLSKQLYFVIHCNHSKELDEDIFAALRKLQELGCLILNQAVLLKGVNDDASTLIELGKNLANRGVLFYYLHQLDRVRGAAHFEVSEERGRFLVAEMAKKLPGYAVPKYVKEIAGEPHKTPL